MTLPSDVRGEDQQAILIAERCTRVADEHIAVQVGGNRRVQTFIRHQLTKGREPLAKRTQHVTERVAMDDYSGQTDTLTGNTEELNVHDAA